MKIETRLTLLDNLANTFAHYECRFRALVLLSESVVDGTGPDIRAARGMVKEIQAKMDSRMKELANAYQDIHPSVIEEDDETPTKRIDDIFDRTNTCIRKIGSSCDYLDELFESTKKPKTNKP